MNNTSLLTLIQESILYWLIIISCIAYLFLSLVLYKRAVQKKLSNKWESFIPIGNLWILGKVINSFKLGKNRYYNAEYRLTVASLVFLITAKIPVIGLMVGTAYFVLLSHCILELLRKMNFNFNSGDYDETL